MKQIFVKNLILVDTHGIYSRGEYADIKLIKKYILTNCDLYSEEKKQKQKQ